MLTKPTAAIVYVATAPQTLHFHAGQARLMASKGFQVWGVAAPGEMLDRFAEGEAAQVLALPMRRAVDPLGDLRAVWRLWRHFRRLRPAIVHSGTPKGGLVGMVAAWLAGVPVRVYQMRGLPHLTATGMTGRLLRLSERTSCALAQRVIANSHSLRQAALEERICPPDRITVLLSGSSNGVDGKGRFNPEVVGAEAGREARRAHSIPASAVVIGFVGRLVRDKGIVELTEAWQRLRGTEAAVHLLVVGEEEPQDPVPAGTMAALRSDERVHLAGQVLDVAPLYAAMDVVTLPSYREGFPNVALEAAAMGLPMVAAAVPGSVDAVAHGVTGTLVPAQDSSALAAALERYVRDPGLRRRHGEAGRERALQQFAPERLREALWQEYARLLAKGPASAMLASGGRAATSRPAPDR